MRESVSSNPHPSVGAGEVRLSLLSVISGFPVLPGNQTSTCTSPFPIFSFNRTTISIVLGFPPLQSFSAPLSIHVFILFSSDVDSLLAFFGILSPKAEFPTIF